MNPNLLLVYEFAVLGMWHVSVLKMWGLGFRVQLGFRV